jgi:predicted metal-dependent HD superfamily phosphohydrolase
VNNILNLVEKHITAELEGSLLKGMHFHNLQHTKEAVQAADEIADYYKLSPKDKEILLIATWFHDLGYMSDYLNHEEKSIEFSEQFLQKFNYPVSDIKTISEIILSTKLNTVPQSDLQKIINDADLAHLAKDNGLEHGEALRKELEELHNKTFTDQDWLKFDLKFYKQTKYYTSYAKQYWQPGLDKNINRIEQRLKE